jgi:hypothetical protein
LHRPFQIAGDDPTYDVEYLCHGDASRFWRRSSRLAITQIGESFALDFIPGVHGNVFESPEMAEPVWKPGPLFLIQMIRAP